MKKTFEEWKREVERKLMQKIGITSEFLPDVPYMQWYKEHMTPATAAAKVVKIAKE
jgi:hypothetical protein